MMQAEATELSRHAAVVMPYRDECELEWFFSRGQTAFEHSTFGAVLDRAELFSVAQHYQAEQRPIHDKHGNVIGYERVVTARPTAETHQLAGYVPDSETLQRYAHVSRRLKRVAAVSRQCAQTLEFLYGDHGQRWVANDLYGRLGALFHLTPKGKAMLAEARAQKGALDVPDIFRMEVFVAVQRSQRQQERGQQLAYCEAQAEAMAARAHQCWLSCRVIPT
jgi:hypothetical protein